MRKLKNEELDRLSVGDYKQKRKSPFIVVLENIRSGHNIGSVFRTADAFLIEKIYLTGFTAKPPHREILKAALGATESVEWAYFNKTREALEHLKAENTCFIAVEQTESSVYLQDFIPEPDKKYVLVFGNEIKGVHQEIVDMCDTCIEIPQFGTKHSFNISVSAGIVFWDLHNKWKK
mgnify:CR=1 FL=1